MRDASRNDDDPAERSRLLEENEKLKDENLNLKIDNRAKEQVITILNRERRDFIGQLKSQATRIGEITANLLALGGPAEDVRPKEYGDNSEAEPGQEGVE